MDRKYQNLYIYWKSQLYKAFRQIELKQISFIGGLVVISFINCKKENERILLSKRNFNIKID